MDTLVSLLTTTEGRIGRQQWWMGVIALIVVSIVAIIVVGIISFGNAMLMGWLTLLVNLLLIWPSYCIGIKRRHDRGSDGTDLKILIAGSVILNLLTATGIGVTMTDVSGVMVPMPTFWMSALNLIFGVFAIYMLVQLGFLKGTTGANDFGADPLAAAS